RSRTQWRMTRSRILWRLRHDGKYHCGMTSLAHLERQILELHGGLSLRPTLEKAAKLGEFLHEVKQTLPHGDFLPWVKRLPFTPRTAQTYILCFQHSGNTKFPSHLTIDGFVRWV